VDELVEITMDFGREPEIRLNGETIYLNFLIDQEDLDCVIDRISRFSTDNRSGIERTLHRILCMRNREGEIVGLTIRIGRALYGTIDIIKDILYTNKSILLLGKPGVGKTTLIREISRVLSTDFSKRVVIVDTSNEIAGDGDIPHDGIGRARRMQVPNHNYQHDVMIEAVQNHMPQVVVIDEIGTKNEAYAARTIAERGVQLVASAHGNTIENLMNNPTLSDLVGGLQSVTLSDDEAKNRGTQKSVLERKANPTFDVIIEIIEKDKIAIHENVSHIIDSLLRGKEYLPETRVRSSNAKGFNIVQKKEIKDKKVVTETHTLKDALANTRKKRNKKYTVIDEYEEY
jgi:stage III sporulation protein SpoIIIAA